MKMSLKSRREYLNKMRHRYQQANSRIEKTQIIEEVVNVVGFHRKYAITVLNQPPASAKPPVKRNRPLKYLEALPAIQAVWEALDYPCAERLHPVLLSTARALARHEELYLDETIIQQLSQISCSTLGRRLKRFQSPKRTTPRPKPSSRLKSEIPVDTYKWDETRSGALEIDLVEHNGGSALGHFAYTLNAVDVVSGWSRRRAVLGRGQKIVLQEIDFIFQQWPHNPWAFHTDCGSEFINQHLVNFCKKHGLEFTRNRPYQKNDNAHIEQKNRQYVREIVGYQRYDTPEEVAWLNQIYALLDVYANLFLPMRKIIKKERQGAKTVKRYDTARTPCSAF